MNNPLAKMSVDQAQEFVIHDGRFGWFPTQKGFCGAMKQVPPHQVAGNPAQGFLHGGYLHNDIGTIAVFLHHFLEAADLTFD
ncbi:MAG TPA: hypothetical protein VKH45_08575 [Candidatus Acidoferrum sp.]|nr:hypothetical protein [Candidatus Acidoferrum sp.]